MGLSYRYSPDLKTKGDISFKNKMIHDDTMVVPLPDIYQFSGFHQITPYVAFHYSTQYTQWSTFDTLSTAGHGKIKSYHWRDAFQYSVGLTVNISQDWTFRTGYMYDASAVDEEKSIAIPDSNRTWNSFGCSYRMNKNTQLDFGLTLIRGEMVRISENINNSIIEGSINSEATIYGLQYSYSY